MAKIEIKRTPEDLERVATFLKSNNIKFDVVKDCGNHSVKEVDAYQKLVNKYCS